MSQDWEEKLSEEFEWSREQPSAKDVAAEAKKYNFESVSDVMSRMEGASSTCSTGFEQWTWFRNWLNAFGIDSISKSDS